MEHLFTPCQAFIPDGYITQMFSLYTSPFSLENFLADTLLIFGVSVHLSVAILPAVRHTACKRRCHHFPFPGQGSCYFSPVTCLCFIPYPFLYLVLSLLSSFCTFLHN